MAVEAARCVALGEPFLGRQVRRGAVVYVAAERFAETDLRLEVAIREAADPPIRLTRAMAFAEGDTPQSLADAILDFAASVGMSVVLVIFDTVAAMIRDGDGDENLVRDVGKLTKAIDLIRERVGAAVIVVHHAKRGEKRGRGSEALEGWAETIALADGSNPRRRLTVLRSNTVEPGLKAIFVTRQVELGTDHETGDTSSVVLAGPADTSSPARPAAREAARLPPDAETAFSELQRMPDPASHADWRAATISAFGERKPGALRQAFNTAKAILVREDLISTDGRSVSVRTASE